MEHLSLSWMGEKAHSLKASRWRKKSLWSWAPIRAIAKIWQQRFYCLFSIFIQTIDGLPSTFQGLHLVVQIERKGKMWQTMPSIVFQHAAEFEETLHIETTIYGRMVNTHNNAMKFLRKDYMLYVVAIDAGEHVLVSQHRIDFSRLLPTSLEGFFGLEKPMSFTMSFNLGSKAQGAVLVATFDFEVFNEVLRQPSLPSDGNASARFGGSPLGRVPRAFNSLPNSPNPSPFVRRSDYHFTSPCTSGIDSDDDMYADVDSSAKRTEDWSLYDYSSSDEDRYQALRNDPLNLDAFVEAEPLKPSPPTRLEGAFGSLDDYKAQLHLVSTKCVEKVEVHPGRRTKSDALGHPIDVRRLLGVQEPGKESIAALSLVQGDTSMASYDAHAQERNDFSNELASDKYCINVESYLKINSSQKGSDHVTSSREMVDGHCYKCGSMLCPSPAKPNGPNSGCLVLTSEKVEVHPSPAKPDGPNSGCLILTAEKVELRREGNGEGMLAVNEEGSCDDKCGVKRSVKRILEYDAASSNPLADAGALALQQEWRLVEGLQESLDPANEVDEGMEGVELDIFALDFEDDDVLSVDANGVVQDFFDLLEREGQSTSTVPTYLSTYEENCKRRDVAATQSELQDGKCPKGIGIPVELENGTFYPLKQEEGQIITCVKPSGTIPKIQGLDDALQTSLEGNFALLSIIEAGECEMRRAAQTLRSKERAKMLEDAETKALMEEYGLSDKMFEILSPTISSPRLCSQQLYASNITSTISLKDGGTLWAMNLNRFQSRGSLVMQVSRPVVLPMKTNVCVVDILRCLASKGLGNMSAMAALIMPLEDIAGLSAEHLVACRKLARDIDSKYHRTKLTSRHMSTVDGSNLGEEAVLFDDLIPTALRKIEPLVLEGLKVQCGLSGDSPYSISSDCVPRHDDEFVPFTLDSSQVSFYPLTSLLDATISLNEWLQRCDGAGEAHHLTTAMLLQLRDPQRYFEPVGALMMALVQAEKVNPDYLRPDLSIDNGAVVLSNHDMNHGIGSKSGFGLKISGLHVSGIKSNEEDMLKCWGTKEQLQSASRWLSSNIKTDRVQHVMAQTASSAGPNRNEDKGEFLWSISAYVHTSTTTQRQAEDFCHFVRNPNIS